MAIPVSNKDARRFFIERQGLSGPPGRSLGKEGLYDLVTRLGFVQVDSIRTVERAHHMILFARNQTYRPAHLDALIEKDRLLFEHWTHDASILPSAFFPYWKWRFLREEPRIREGWRKWRGEGFEAVFEETLERIRTNGPVMARDLKAEDHVSGGWWNWHPSKTALEFLWRTGHLAIAGRTNFQKVYDLSSRVLPADLHAAEVDHDAFVDFACRGALMRLGFATPGEIAAFFALVSPQEARDWVAAHRDELEEVAIAPAAGEKPRPAFAFAGIAGRIGQAPEPPARIRVLSPFDPLLRDRSRAERLFGFFYRIEVFVPEGKRQYGYYVFPLIEGDRLIGRIDMKAERGEGVLSVRRLWLEPGVRASSGRLEKLDAELQRVARFCGVERVDYRDGWRG
ncbi:winged helix-turn-helix domain-containing protein [Rhizobiaceae bacterium BDR2-2]|uniref:Winged helix-turn-helix domain-containing protein n=1 Tax=Ectorhizobium quercum TaxID=2965071 RepID=A0AAE3SUX9_9HYPH|nr:winged helix-turn-helix domain-containing protein [Ectorhizobium quercum]MCX8996369.1 winged helix-turn-helix domain-containing protein [Ectorhizobium quercum]MCX8998592.1 winged helix-turn-helix domain-containing protein [Ectorhizobium quercum]